MTLDIQEDQQKLQPFTFLGKDFAVMQITKGENGHDNKKPIDPRNGRLMKWKQDPCFTTLADTFTNLAGVRKANPDMRFEVGALLKDGLIMLDIDNIYNEIANKDNPDGLLAKLHQLTKNTYCEVSQSGRGVHFFFTGTKTRKEIRNDKYELYDSNRWATLTGTTLWATSEIKHLSEQEMAKLEQFLWGDPKPEKPKSANIEPSNAKFDDADIKKLITKAINAKNGDKFSTLYNGESPSGDVSSDDMAFALMLAFWTQKNAKMMDAIFRQSKRMRPKWDEIHSVDGQTYGEMTIENAIANTDEVYHENTNNYGVDKSKIKSNQDLIKALKHARAIWDKQHTVDDKTMPITSKPTEIIKILIDIVDFAVIYTEDKKSDRNLYFYDYDEGIYSQNADDFESIILAVVPEMINPKTRQNLLDTILKMPTDKIPTVQNLINTDKGKDLLAVGNGVVNLKTKELTPFSPSIYITSKDDTNYNPNATQEPIINGWSWSKTLKQISDGDLDKLQLLWQTAKAAICGISNLRQMVLLVDDGRGQTGKSTFEDALIGVVGTSNVASLKIVEFSDETKLIDAVDKRLIIGDDNDVYTVVSRYDYLNPAISSELIRVRNYYQKSQSTSLHAFILQSCNGIPPFHNATPAFFNRLKIIKFNRHHDFRKLDDNNVKSDYIKRKEFREWLLWYVINNVHIGTSLVDTQENKDLIADAQIENDTITNFIENWLPDLQSTVIPTGWLYDYYATACVMDSMPNDSMISRKRFMREIMDNEEFTQKWSKKASRLTPKTFVYSDVISLMNLYNSTRWGKDLKTWFPVSSITEKKDENNSTTHQTITEPDYLIKINKYHGQCFIKK